MAQVQMPGGEVVEMPDNPTPDQLAQLALIHSPSGVAAPVAAPTPTAPTSIGDALNSYFENVKQNLSPTPANKAAGQEGAKQGIRMAVNGLTGMAGLGADAFQGASNILTQTPGQMPSAAIQQTLNSTLGPDPHPMGTLAGSMLFGSMDPAMLALRKLVPAAVPAMQGAVTPAQVQAQTMQNAMNSGYKFTPSQSPSAGMGSQMLEALGGSVNLKQKMQQANYDATQAIAAREAGLPAGSAITPASIQNAITDTYQNGYEPIRNIPLLNMGRAYTSDLQNIANATPQTGVGNFNPAAVASAYHQPFMGGAEAIDNIKQLRQLAHDAYASNAVDKTLRGNTYQNIASAIENGVGRALPAGSDMLSDYQGARTQLAKQFAIRKAMIPGTGGIDAADIGTQMANQIGKTGYSPFTDGLATMGETANAFPKALHTPTTVAPGLTKMDQGILAGAAYAAKEGGLSRAAGLLGLGLIRPAIRKGLLSGSYQRAFIQPNPAPGLFSQLIGNQGVQNAVPTALQQLFGPKQ